MKPSSITYDVATPSSAYSASSAESETSIVSGVSHLWEPDSNWMDELHAWCFDGRSRLHNIMEILSRWISGEVLLTGASNQPIMWSLLPHTIWSRHYGPSQTIRKDSACPNSFKFDSIIHFSFHCFIIIGSNHISLHSFIWFSNSRTI